MRKILLFTTIILAVLVLFICIAYYTGFLDRTIAGLEDMQQRTQDANRITMLQASNINLTIYRESEGGCFPKNKSDLNIPEYINYTQECTDKEARAQIWIDLDKPNKALNEDSDSNFTNIAGGVDGTKETCTNTESNDCILDYMVESYVH